MPALWEALWPQSRKDLHPGLAPEQACLGPYLSQVCLLGGLTGPVLWRAPHMVGCSAVTVYKFFYF